MRLLIINNLASGHNEGKIFDFMRRFSHDGDEIVIRTSDGTTDLREFLHDARSFDLVVACGGDGTVATVSYLLANSGVPILPFPAGTANLLALNLISPTEPHALAELAREGKTLDFDLGELEIAGNRYGFGIMAGAGYDAAIMKEAEPNKLIWGPFAYFGAAVAKAKNSPSHFTITVDGERHEIDGLCVLVINFAKIQFDISVTHNNCPRDGYLEVAVLKGENAFELIPLLGSALLDTFTKNTPRSSQMEIFKGKEVTVEASPAMEIQYDGEVTRQYTPFTARVCPSAARYVISEEGYRIYTEQQQSTLE